MKTIKKLLAIVGLLCFFYNGVSAQSERVNRLAKEVLVFIKQDSFDLAPTRRLGATVQQSNISSQQLKETLDFLNVNSIARSFPDWPEVSAVSFNDRGDQVNPPDFHRIFTLTFASEREAEEAVRKLNKLPAVVYAERHTIGTLDNDPRYLDGSQWHLRNDERPGADINAEGAWSIFTGCPSVIIGIFDTGVELDHDEFRGRVTGDSPRQRGDQYFHGTQVAGMVAARANNRILGRGLDWNAQVRSYLVLDHHGFLVGDNVVANIIVGAVRQGVQVLNHSWSAPTLSNTFAQAFAYAYKMNRISVATMGNSGKIERRYPGGFKNVIAVGATNNRDVRWTPLSTMGDHIDVVAPGQNVFTTTTGNSHIFESGTSLAAPLVSGLASLLRGFRPALANDDIRQIIRLSVDRTPGMGNQNFTIAYGFGRINAGRALEMVRDYTIRQWAVTGGVVYSSYSTNVLFIYNQTARLQGNHNVRRHDVRRTVYFPEQFAQIKGVWGRGVGSIGWNASNPNFGEGFTEVVSYTSNSVTLKTYVYEVWNTAGNFLGWFPTRPENVRFAYTVLGTIMPTISGPATLCAATTYRLSNPDLRADWSVTSGFEITSVYRGVDRVTVVPTNLRGEQGVLTAVVNGIPISRPIQACSVAIVGPATVCCYRTTFTLNPSPGGTIHWSITGPFTTSNTIGNQVTVIQPSPSTASGVLTARRNSSAGTILATKNITPCNALFFINQTVSSNRTINHNGNVCIRNVSVINNATLLINATREVFIDDSFEVAIGSTFEIR